MYTFFIFNIFEFVFSSFFSGSVQPFIILLRILSLSTKQSVYCPSISSLLAPELLLTSLFISLLNIHTWSTCVRATAVFFFFKIIIKMRLSPCWRACSKPHMIDICEENNNRGRKQTNTARRCYSGLPAVVSFRSDTAKQARKVAQKTSYRFLRRIEFPRANDFRAIFTLLV